MGEAAASDVAMTRKVILVGNSGVGKSSIITKYIDNQFSENYFSNVSYNGNFL